MEMFRAVQNRVSASCIGGSPPFSFTSDRNRRVAVADQNEQWQLLAGRGLMLPSQDNEISWSEVVRPNGNEVERVGQGFDHLFIRHAYPVNSGNHYI
jgi:hypothetical protein